MAATRARDLLVVSIPKKTTDDVVKVLHGFGLAEWGQAKLAVTPLKYEVKAPPDSDESGLGAAHG